MQILHLTNVFLLMKAVKENKITAQDAVLCDLFLKNNFRIVNKAYCKFSQLGFLTAIRNVIFSISIIRMHLCQLRTYVHRQHHSEHGVILLLFGAVFCEWDHVLCSQPDTTKQEHWDFPPGIKYTAHPHLYFCCRSAVLGWNTCVPTGNGWFSFAVMLYPLGWTFLSSVRKSWQVKTSICMQTVI